MGYFGDAVSAMDVSAMDLRSTLLLPNFWTYTQCQAYSIDLRKFLLLIFLAKVAENICRTSIETSIGLFCIWLYVSWTSPLSKLWHHAQPNACSRSPRSNLWHPAVRTGVRPPGGNCWQRIGSTNILVHRQPTDRKKQQI